MSGTPLFSVSQTYDANSNVLTVTDGNGRTTTSAYDNNNRLVSVTQPPVGTPPQSPVATNAYYANGLLHTQTDPNGRVTTFTYDSRNLLATETDGLNSTTTLTYDARGNRRNRTDARAISTTSTYDLRNTLTGVTYSDGTPYGSYTYDRTGNRTAMSTTTSSVSYIYNSLNRPTTITSGSCTFSYQYDPAGNLTSVQYPDCPNGEDRTVAYTYHPGGLTASVSAFSFPFGTSATYTYDAAGRETRMDYPNGARALRAYDAAGRLTFVENQQADATVITSHSYTLNGVGNTTSAVEHIGTTTYSYDAVNRLTEVVYPSNQSVNYRKSEYVYNQSGDRTAWKRWQYGCWGGGEEEPCNEGYLLVATDNYSYNAGGRMTEAGGVSHSYDADGNQTSFAGLSTAYGWDAESRLKSAQSGGFTYGYDADGNRTGKVEVGGSNIPTSYLLDYRGGRGRVAVQNVNDGRTFYIYGAGGRLVQQMFPTGPSKYYHVDGLGNTRATTDTYGNPTSDSKAYGAFGEDRAASGMSDIARQYLSEQWDPENGLSYMGRYYNPQLGRYLSRGGGGSGTDPQGLNRYTYAANSPVAPPFLTPAGQHGGAGVGAAAVPAATGGGVDARVVSSGHYMGEDADELLGKMRGVVSRGFMQTPELVTIDTDAENWAQARTGGAIPRLGPEGTHIYENVDIPAGAYAMGHVLVFREKIVGYDWAKILAHEVGHARQAEIFGSNYYIYYGMLLDTYGYDKHPWEIAAIRFGEERWRDYSSYVTWADQ